MKLICLAGATDHPRPLLAPGVTQVVALAAPLIAEVFAEPRATAIIRGLALRPLLQALSSGGVARLTREFRFRALATLWLVEALVNTAVTIVLVFSLRMWALVVGALAGPLAFTILSYILAPHQPRLRLGTAAIAPLVRFGRWIFVTGIIPLAGRTVLRATISREVGVAELGLYSLAVRLAFLPSEVSCAVVGSVAFPLLARLQHDAEKMATAFRGLYAGLAVLLIPIVGPLVVLAPSLEQVVFSAQWEGTAPLIALLAGIGGVLLGGGLILVGDRLLGSGPVQSLEPVFPRAVPWLEGRPVRG